MMLRLERVLQKQQEDDDFQQAFHALETSKAELEYWESLTFSFDHSDMAKNDPNGPPHPHQWPSSAASPSAAAQVMDLLPFSRQTSQAFFQPVVPDLITLARLAASAGLLQGPVTEEHLSMLVNTLQHTVANAERPLQPPVYPQIHPQSQPYTNQAPQMQSLRRTTLETRPVLPGRRQSQQYFDQGWERSSGIHTPISSVPPLTPGHNFPQTYAYEFGRNNQPIPGNEDARIRAPSDAVASSSGYTLDQASTGVDEDDDDGSVNAEDKRSRNTAASARFRVKKKLRTLDLERSVTALTSRAEALEREVSELREENRFLKELVMLKTQETIVAPEPADVSESDFESTDRPSKGKSRAN